MKKILVLVSWLWMILMAGCSLWPKTDDINTTDNIANSWNIANNNSWWTVKEDKEIQDFFDFIEKTIKEETDVQVAEDTPAPSVDATE